MHHGKVLKRINYGFRDIMRDRNRKQMLRRKCVINERGKVMIRVAAATQRREVR
jgi:hypothetical protein